MKKIVFILLVFISFISKAQVYIGSDGAIHPSGNYPAYLNKEGKATWRSVTDTTERNNIPSNSRLNWMFVYTNVDSTIWRLDSTQNPIWVLYSKGSPVYNIGFDQVLSNNPNVFLDHYSNWNNAGWYNTNMKTIYFRSDIDANTYTEIQQGNGSAAQLNYTQYHPGDKTTSLQQNTGGEIFTQGLDSNGTEYYNARNYNDLTGQHISVSDSYGATQEKMDVFKNHIELSLLNKDVRIGTDSAITPAPNFVGQVGDKVVRYPLSAITGMVGYQTVISNNDTLTKQNNVYVPNSAFLNYIKNGSVRSVGGQRISNFSETLDSISIKTTPLPLSVIGAAQSINLHRVDSMFLRSSEGGAITASVYKTFTSSSGDTLFLYGVNDNGRGAYSPFTSKTLFGGIDTTLTSRRQYIGDSLNRAGVKITVDIPSAGVALKPFYGIYIDSPRINDSRYPSTFLMSKMGGIHIAPLKTANSPSTTAIWEEGLNDTVDIRSNVFIEKNLPTGTAVVGIGIDANGKHVQYSGSGGSVSVGAFSNTSTANGLDITTNVLALHAADATNPGAVSITTQSFSGQKTFKNTTWARNYTNNIQPSSNKRYVLAYGASVTSGFAAAQGNGYINDLVNNLRDTLHSLSLGGTKIDYFFTIPPVYYSSDSTAFVTMQWGINEALNAWDTATYHADYIAAIDSLIARGFPVSKIVIIQCPPLLTVNTSPYGYVDSLVAAQFGTIFAPTFTALNNASYLNFLVDGTHPKDAGHLMLGNLVTNAIISATSYDTVYNYINDSTGDIAAKNVVVKGVLKAGYFSSANDIMAGGATIGVGSGTSGFIGGYQAGYNISTNISYTAIGNKAYYTATSGTGATAIGNQALYNTTTATQITGVGYQTMFSNTTGRSSTGIGGQALYYNTTGSNNVGIGVQAGTFATNNFTTHNSLINRSILIGDSTRPLTSGDINEIIIGDTALGHGSNTITLGNTSTTGFYPYGVGVGVSTDSVVMYNPTTRQMRYVNASNFGGGGGAVSSVSNSDGTLTISPTTGSVVSSLNLAHANTWTATQTYANSISTSGNYSLAAWGPKGANFSAVASTYTDNSSSGTVGTITAINSFGTPAIAASSSSTYTNAANVYIAGAPTGGTGATITNSWALYVNAGQSGFGQGFTTNPSAYTSGNLFTSPTTSNSNSFTGAATVLFGGASQVSYRNAMAGSGAVALNANNSYANFIVGSSTVTAASSGTHAVIANAVIKKLGVITNASSVPITETANLYIDSASAGGTNNYPLHIAGALSTSLIDGSLKANGTLTVGTLATGSNTDSLLVTHGGTGLVDKVAQVILASGTYTSTLTNTTNITTSSFTSATYTRVGNIVHVMIGGGLTPTTASVATVLTVTLPLTTATTSQNYIGTGSIANNSGAATYDGAIVNIVSGTTATITFVPTLNVSTNFSVEFDYTL